LVFYNALNPHVEKPMLYLVNRYEISLNVCTLYMIYKNLTKYSIINVLLFTIKIMNGNSKGPPISTNPTERIISPNLLKH